MPAILFNRLIGPVPVSVVMREVHETSLGITELPIETGAKITDHAYVEPKRLDLEIADADAVATYNALVRFQETRIPFTFVSGLFVYPNMLIRGLRVERDANSSRVLSGRVELQEAIIVSTAYVAEEGDSTDAQSKGKPGGKNSTQSARPTSGRASDAATKDRAAGTTMRGDVGAKTVNPSQNRSILSGILQ